MYARSKKCVGVDPLCIPAYPSMLNPFLGLPPGSLHTPSKPLYVKLSPFLAASPPKPSLFTPQALHFRNPRLSVSAFCLLNHQLESWRGGFRAAFDKKEKWVLLGCVTCVFPWPASQMSLHTQLPNERVKPFVPRGINTNVLLRNFPCDSTKVGRSLPKKCPFLRQK